MIKKEILALMGTMRNFIVQLPQNKQIKAVTQITKISKEQLDDEKALRDLTYQFNFLKLTNPHIKVSQVVSPEDQQQMDDMLAQQPNEEIAQPITQIKEQHKTGTYILQDGKLVEGHAEKRSSVDYSNWYAGNVDPEDMKKHKELLDRQHYSGPFWEGKPKPKSILSELPSDMISSEMPEREMNPNIKKPKEMKVEQVKR